MASHGGGGGKGKGRDQSKYESTAAGLGGGGGGSGDVGGDVLAEVLEGEVGLDVAGCDVSVLLICLHPIICAMCILLYYIEAHIICVLVSYTNLYLVHVTILY